MTAISPSDYLQSGSGVVTLCGSTKFFNECLEVNRDLTFKNWVVLMCGSWGHSYHAHLPQVSVNHEVKKLHFKKILMSHCIVVVSDDSGYIGESTKKEIEFCEVINKPIIYWQPNQGYTGEFITLTPPDYNDLPSTVHWDYTQLIKQLKVFYAE